MLKAARRAGEMGMCGDFTLALCWRCALGLQFSSSLPTQAKSLG